MAKRSDDRPRTTREVFDSARELIFETEQEGELRVPTCISIVWLRKEIGEHGMVTTTDGDQDKHDLAAALENLAARLRSQIDESFIPTEPPIKAEEIEAEKL